MLLVETRINFVVTTVHLLTIDDMMEQRIFILHKYIQQLHVDILYQINFLKTTNKC